MPQENLKNKYRITEKELRKVIDRLLASLKKEELGLPIIAVADLLQNGDIQIAPPTCATESQTCRNKGEAIKGAATYSGGSPRKGIYKG